MPTDTRRVLVTGARGFLGSYLVDEVKRRGYATVLAPSRAECDFVEARSVAQYFQEMAPTHVIHAAAAVGGIGANVAQAGYFSYANTAMAANVLESCRTQGVAKLLSVGTICVYPAHAPVPTPETAMFDGFPAVDTAPYGIAKRNLWMMGVAYRKQYGLNATFVIPTNLYGPRDHFDDAKSHVVPALIRRALEARASGVPELTVWGDGTATRDLLYVADAARGMVDALEAYDEPDPINLGTGREVTVRELVETIVSACDYTGRIVFDASKPQGAPRRALDSRRARDAFGFVASTTLEVGLRATIDWYRTTVTGTD
jgi:nucleoside-diphosphate-sugar epimerase